MATKIEYRSDFTVKLLDTMGDDERICEAARVSNLGARSYGSGESAGLINYLMSTDRDSPPHGSPFEHVIMQWLITAPIFVWREFHRHRIASYNEQSSRWMTLEPVFYVDAPTRPMFKTEGSRKGDYANTPADGPEQEAAAAQFIVDLQDQQASAYQVYEDAISDGIVGEVARQVLPVSIYSSCWVTMNARALMNFLSLRTHRTALEEIRAVADLMEDDFATHFEITHAAWLDNGRVAP